MNRKRKKSNNKTSIKKNKITRCKNKMIPVFENDTCEDYLKKEHLSYHFQEKISKMQ